MGCVLESRAEMNLWCSGAGGEENSPGKKRKGGGRRKEGGRRRGQETHRSGAGSQASSSLIWESPL